MVMKTQLFVKTRADNVGSILRKYPERITLSDLRRELELEKLVVCYQIL